MTGFSLQSASTWLMAQQQSFASEAVTYQQSDQPDVTGVLAVLGDDANELIDGNATLMQAVGQPFVFKASELNRTPGQGDIIVRADGSEYRVVPLADDEQPYRQRGDMLRVFTRKVKDAT